MQHLNSKRRRYHRKSVRASALPLFAADGCLPQLEQFIFYPIGFGRLAVWAWSTPSRCLMPTFWCRSSPTSVLHRPSPSKGDPLCSTGSVDHHRGIWPDGACYCRYPEKWRRFFAPSPVYGEFACDAAHLQDMHDCACQLFYLRHKPKLQGQGLLSGDPVPAPW